jgi:hypothetical protein
LVEKAPTPKVIWYTCYVKMPFLYCTYIYILYLSVSFFAAYFDAAFAHIVVLLLMKQPFMVKNTAIMDHFKKKTHVY